MVAPQTLAIRLLSVFLTLLITEQFPCLSKKCYAKSETPFSVITTSGLHFKIFLHIFQTSSRSSYNSLDLSEPFVISISVLLSPFLYSSGKSNNKILGLFIVLLIPE